MLAIVDGIIRIIVPMPKRRFRECRLSSCG